MSGTNVPPYNLPSPPTTAQIAAQILASMGAESGVVTDYNQGSQIRTFSESVGSVNELQGVVAQALAFQTIVYGAYSAFGISPIGALAANGTVTFSTGPGNVPVGQGILIPSNTLLQTTGGTQFVTTETVTLASGSYQVNATVSAVQPGTSGNQTAGSITQILTGLPYPLYVTNAASTTGGAQAETPSQTLSRFIAKVASIGLSSPVAVANAVIGVTVSGTTEMVRFSSLYEPWIGASGVASGQASFQLFIDNGSGAASSNLINAVIAWLNGNISTNQSGYRPAGVPYGVSGVVPVTANIIVSGTPTQSSFASTLTTNVTNNINTYFQSIAFGQNVYATNIIAVAANSVGNYVSNLSVTLENASGVSVTGLVSNYNNRIILGTLTVTL